MTISVGSTFSGLFSISSHVEIVEGSARMLYDQKEAVFYNKFSGLKRVHADPDVYVIEAFLDPAACADLIACAKAKKLAQSPVAYAGWTKDANDLLGLAAKGPVSWLSIGGAWLQTKDDSSASVVDFFRHAAPTYLLLYVL
ncbi:hypothetical protein B484DRAFT_406821, partial [Ochromonadaceae sp. CCMP2298]